MVKTIEIILVIFLSNFGYGQKKVLRLPESLLIPFYPEENVEEYKLFTKNSRKSNGRNKRGENFWVVLSDRENNLCYKKPHQSSEVSHTLMFKEIAYVVDEKDNWILIGIGTLDDGKLKYYKEFGWILKSKVLLWSHAFSNGYNSGKEIIGIINSKFDFSTTKSNFKDVPIYSNPTKGNSFNTLLSSSFCNVYKEEGDFFLIGSNKFIEYPDLDLTGWVHQSNIILLNSRLFVEPCYEEEAFNFRKNNLDNRVRGFITRPQAARCAEVNECKEGILWDNDPAKLIDSSYLASGGRRHKGELFRFPILSTSSQVYRSMVFDKNVYSFKEIYLPRPKLSFPLYSFSVLFTDSELTEYTQLLMKLENGLSINPKIQRDKLVEILTQIIKNIYGQKISKSQIEKINIDEIRLAMAAIKSSSDFEMKDKFNITIGEIKDKKILSDSKLKSISESINNKLQTLSNILSQGKSYEFSFSLNDDKIFYWIPVEFMF